ncbi:MAG TPA: hypothetical protein VHL98_11055 [Microvirga sp.]|jgi:hypothetical protein|nr:hypothetical protein [Microvirga sp.]
MSQVETIRIKSGDSFAIINKSDFDPKQHTPFDAEAKEAAGNDGLTDEERKLYAELDAKRKVAGNFGQTGGAGLDATASVKNPSGTYSEPTPTDVRYPDKQATEFENNLGAFVDKSAAQMREARGMEDRPGGIKPEVADAVANAEAAAAAIREAATSGGTGTDSGVVNIPENWRELPWQQKRSLASQVSDGPVRNGDDADKAIEAELERRGQA